MKVDQSTAEHHTILRTVVGSQLMGLSTDSSDQDEMGVMIEPFAEAFTLGEGFEQFERGTPDLTIYSLRKFCRLAARGNPTLLLLLYAPHEFHTQCDARGHQLQEHVDWFVSKEATGAFLGYLQQQKQRMVGEKGQKRCHRPELESKHGYDVKYAMHMLRLGFQGVEFLTTGRLTLPIREPDRSYLMQVRRGELDMQTVFTKAGELERELKDLKETSRLPDHPDREAIESWMQNVYLMNWKAQLPHGRFTGSKLEDYTPDIGEWKASWDVKA